MNYAVVGLRRSVRSPSPRYCETCAQYPETTEHFLLDCFLYDIERQTLLSELPGVLEKGLDKYNKKELAHILLYGEYSDNPEKYEHNKILFRYVQKFLIQTKRLVYKSRLQYVP